MEKTDTNRNKGNIWALTPLVFFLCFYLGTSLWVNDFYKIPISVAFLFSSVFALLITKGLSSAQRLSHFTQGASHRNILTMIWIFILAGAFAQSAKAMGAIDATVNLILYILPSAWLLPGLFIAACFISFAIGTSVGTIVALTPMAVGLALKTGIDVPYMVAIIVGGSFFGDNLSFISDTTIAATQTQGCMMKDKFRVNFRIVFPAALLVTIFYFFSKGNVHIIDLPEQIEWLKIIPYILVILLAIVGINVNIVLLMGILGAGIIGCATGSLSVWDWFGSMGTGISGMGDLIIITMLAGGMLELIRYNGGIDYIIYNLTKHIKSKRGAELSIAGLVSFANVCTANNTIAIITVGKIAADIAQRFNIDRRKSASILDTFSCLVQGIIPYGAQLLMAAGLASVSPLSIVPYLYYPFVLGVFALFSIFFRYPRKYS